MKIPYGKQWISDDDVKQVIEILKSDYLTTGPMIEKFEEAFAKYVGSKYAVAVANGTAALHLAAQALDVRKGSEIITTGMSFAATSNCVLYNQGTPVFVDITERGLIDPAEVSNAITDRTTGIIPVHLMGLPCNLDKISNIAKENGLFVIEDASHAIGAKYKGSSIGNCKYSDLTTFSFHPVKHITTGEGGLITTNDEDLYDLLCTLRTHGILKDKTKFKSDHDEPWYQEMQYLGFNYRLTAIQAALGFSQLKRIDEFIRRRREIAALYNDFFEQYSDQVEIIPEFDDEFHSYHLYIIKLNDGRARRHMFESLAKKGIYCQVHYIPIYWHPYYRESGYGSETHPKTEEFYERIISLPMYPAMTPSEQEYVLQTIKEILTD